MFVFAFFCDCDGRASKQKDMCKHSPYHIIGRIISFFIYGAFFPMRTRIKAGANSANSHPNLSAFKKRRKLNKKGCNIKWNGTDALQHTYVCRQSTHAIFTCSFNCLENGLESLFDVNLKQLL